ncbi:MAG: bifunctional diaminohydroxyphosphoribosylaminopyrimidine deaminase/5-amino-6-(5-phosphoribosylamino)uracil reductase RibD [Phycisphaerales bacterium]
MDDAKYMKRALGLARRGLGRVEPNPMVGCVIVGEGKVLGEGWHRKFGGAHAEVEALRKALKQAPQGVRGVTVYVTLEPCGHWGKTPPCAERLIEAGVGRVVIGTLDPVSGHGSVERLRGGGIAVEIGICEEEAKELICPFGKVMGTGLPWVICKWAATIDGAIATAGGDSQWISNEASRRMVHQLRGRVDAIVVGVGTVIADDPMLDARDVRVRRVARRVVMDPELRISMDCRLVATAGDVPVMVVCSRIAKPQAAGKAAELRARGVEVLEVGCSGKRGLDIAAMLRHLVKAHGATNVLVEGGGMTHGRFLNLPGAGVVDELMVFVGAGVVGGGGVRAGEGAGVGKMADARRWRLSQVKRIGDDVLMRYLGK